MYDQLISILLNCPETQHISIVSLLENRDDPTIGRPLTLADTRRIPCNIPGGHNMEFYVKATPFLIACNMWKISICNDMLNHMPLHELHLDQVWQDTTALIIACTMASTLKWTQMISRMLTSENVHVMYMPKDKKDALYYVMRTGKYRQSLLCDFFMHMVAPHHPPEIYHRAFQLIDSGGLILDQEMPVNSGHTLFTRLVNTYEWDNIMMVFTDLFTRSPDHLQKISSNATSFWYRLVNISTSAFISEFIRIPYIQSRMKTDPLFFSNLFVPIVEQGWAEESMFILDFAVENSIQSFVINTKHMDSGQSVYELVREIVEEDHIEEMHGVMNALDVMKQEDELRAVGRKNKYKEYYMNALDEIYHSRKGTQRPTLNEDVEKIIASYNAVDDGRHESAPIGGVRANITRRVCKRSRRITQKKGHKRRKIYT